MAMSRHLSAFVALLLAAGIATAQAQEREWVSYRDAYRAMVVFEKYGRAKNFLQNHFQVMPKDSNVPSEGLQLSLNGKSTQLALPLDATGRAVFPLLKAAYDENAALVLNRKVNRYVFRPRVSIVTRADGVYEAPDLRAACQQALSYARYVDASSRANKCVGVRFVFAKKSGDASVKLRKGEGDQPGLPVAEGPAFAGDPNDGFKTVTYRFGDGPERGQVVTPNAPLAIVPLIE
jgi:hypothetical protein